MSLFQKRYFCAAVVKTMNQEIRWHVHCIITTRLSPEQILDNIGERLRWSHKVSMDDTDKVIVTALNRI